MPETPLLNQSVLVTGGGRGIGRAFALAFAKAGAKVAVTARTRSEIDAVANEICQSGSKEIAVECDVTDCKSVEQMIETVTDKLGPVSILVNNAGGGLERKPVGDDCPETWRQVIDVNLMGTYHCSRAVLPGMKSLGGGKIINVGSGMGHQARPNNSSYNAAKAAVTMLTKCLSIELWEYNIAVNELIPGPVATQLTADIFQADAPHPAFASEWVKRPEDVVPMAMFLATQPDKGPTGQTFSIARRPVSG
jgi:3-oxoacyl-[acyl-carrier protein] reductase